MPVDLSAAGIKGRVQETAWAGPTAILSPSLRLQPAAVMVTA